MGWRGNDFLKLSMLFLTHGKLVLIRSDNGPECIAEAFQKSLSKVDQTDPVYAQVVPGTSEGQIDPVDQFSEEGLQ